MAHKKTEKEIIQYDMELKVVIRIYVPGIFIIYGL